MKENIDKLIERIYDEISKFGDGKLEFETKEIERITKLAKKYINLQEQIQLLQEQGDSDLYSIGELVLNEFDMWL